MNKKLYKDVVEFVIKKNRCSISYLQRVFRIKYFTAIGIIKLLEANGIIRVDKDGDIKVLRR